MTASALTLRTALAAACLALAPLPALACGSDFVLGDEVGAAHPASIGVAFAMLDARSAGMLPPNAAPAGAGPRESADQAVHRLEQRLASVRSKLPPVSLLLVEARLWTRYAPAGTAHAAADAGQHADHAAGPAEGDVVVVTGEAVLRGLLDGAIPWDRAVAGGLVVLAGDPAKRTRVAALLANRFAAPGGTALARR